MATKPLDEIAESVLVLFPLARQLVKTDPEDPAIDPFRNRTFHVLKALHRSGPLPMSALGRRLYMAKQNMTSLIDRLEKDGLTERESDPEDRRVIRIRLTEKGAAFLGQSLRNLKVIVKRNLSPLSEEDLESFRGALRTLKDILARIEAGARHD